MIITLNGIVTHKGDAFAVVEAQGVGYQVNMNKPSLAALRVGTTAKFWTHEYLRDDSRELYGFANRAEHRLFLKLLAVSGVGPKMAMNILSLGAVKEIETMIEKGDILWLTRIPGIGKKTAQKIVLDLKGKLALDDGSGADDEVAAALVDLGYSRDQARRVLEHASTGSVEERLRSALRQLGR